MWWIWRRGLWEAVSYRWTHEGGVCIMGFVSSWDPEDIGAVPSRPPICEDMARKWWSVNRIRAFTKNPTMLASRSWTSLPPELRNKYLLFKLLGHSLNRLRQLAFFKLIIYLAVSGLGLSWGALASRLCGTWGLSSLTRDRPLHWKVDS